VRIGPPDDEADYSLPVWAGVVPTVVAAPIADPRLHGITLPTYVQNYTRMSGK